MKKSNEPQVPSSFIRCIKRGCSMNVDACRLKKCAAKCDALHTYDHGKPGELDD